MLNSSISLLMSSLSISRFVSFWCVIAWQQKHEFYFLLLLILRVANTQTLQTRKRCLFTYSYICCWAEQFSRLYHYYYYYLGFRAKNDERRRGKRKDRKWERKKLDRKTGGIEEKYTYTNRMRFSCFYYLFLQKSWQSSPKRERAYRSRLLRKNCES